MDDQIFEPDLSNYFGPDPEYAELDHKELIKKLEDNSLLEEVRHSESWRIFREAWRRIYKTAELHLDNVDPSQTTRIIADQLTKRFYKDVLATTIRKVKEDGVSAFSQAKDRGILGRLFPDLKKDV
jgi:hypothetical protein